jgi:hypothetical protein
MTLIQHYISVVLAHRMVVYSMEYQPEHMVHTALHTRVISTSAVHHMACMHPVTIHVVCAMYTVFV